MATTLPRIETRAPAELELERTPDNSFPQAPWMVPRVGNDDLGSGPSSSLQAAAVAAVAGGCSACAGGDRMAQLYSEDGEGGDEEGFFAADAAPWVDDEACPVTGQVPCRCLERGRGAQGQGQGRGGGGGARGGLGGLTWRVGSSALLLALVVWWFFSRRGRR